MSRNRTFFSLQTQIQNLPFLLTLCAGVLAWMIPKTQVNAQVEFTPTTLPCGVTVVDIEYINCPDWSGWAGVSMPNNSQGVNFVGSSTVQITDGTGSVEIEILTTAPDSFELAIGTADVNDDPGNCMSQGYEYTTWFYTDCNPCSGFTAGVTNVVDESCDGSCDGEATADPSGGTAPYSYEWSDGQMGEIATDLCAGTFTVTVTDANGCQATVSVTIDAGPVETVPVFDLDTSFCLTDDPIDLPTTSDNDVTGSWSGPGVSGDTFNPTDAGVGSHDLTFTPDAGQCASSTTVMFLVDDCGCQNPASADAGDDQEVCATSDVTVQLDGEITNVSTATWSTSGSGSFDDPDLLDAVYTPSQADRDAGSVTLTLTTADPDGSGPCSPASDQMIVEFLFQPMIGDYDDLEVCFWYELPAIDGEVTDSAAYFTESGGSGEGLLPGDTISETVKLYVYDVAQNCSDEDSFTINIIKLGANAGSNTSVPSGDPAYLNGSAFAGSGDYAFEWSPDSLVVNPQALSTETIPLEEMQTFTFEVTDLETGCVARDKVDVDVTPRPLTVGISADGPPIICGEGSIILRAFASGGSGQYSYTWSDGSNTDSIVVSPDETTSYSVEVNDGFSQVKVWTIITVGSIPDPNVEEEQYLCFGEESLELCVEEVADASYAWHGMDGAFRSGRCASLTAGHWELVVIKNSGCLSRDTLIVEELDQLIVELYPDTNVEISGGLAPYDTSYTQSGDTLTVTVSDNNGCMATESFVITSSPLTPVSPSFQVFPNPAQDLIQIQDMSTEIKRLELWDMQGRLHLQQVGRERNMRIDDIPAGLYILRIYDTQGSVGERQVVIVR